MRPLGNAACWLVLAALIGAVTFGGAAAGRARQEGTPAPAPPATVAPPAAATAPPAATEAPAPGPSAQVTLVAWYATDPSGDFIALFPLEANQEQFSGPEAGLGAVGRADFPEDGSLPSIQLNDNLFTAYLRFEGDPSVERRIWFDETEGERPSTLVLQVAGTEGTYQNFFGTATFVSRDEASVNDGVLVLSLQPPTTLAPPAAATAPAATAPPAEVAGAATAPAEVVTVATTVPPTAAPEGAEPTAAPEGEAEATTAPTEEAEDE